MISHYRKCKICGEQALSIVCNKCDLAYKKRFGYRKDVDLNWELFITVFWAAQRASRAEKKRSAGLW